MAAAIPTKAVIQRRAQREVAWNADSSPRSQLPSIEWGGVGQESARAGIHGPNTGRASLWLALLAILVVCLTACSSDETTPLPSYLTAVLSQDLSVGPQRIAFIVLDPDRERIEVSQAEITAYYLGDDREAPGERRETAAAVFRPWPVGNTGLYSARMNFADAGLWRAEVAITPPGESSRTVPGYFRVSANSFTPSIGSDAPPSDTKTVADVASLEEITSSPVPDPALYQISVADAVASGKPTMVSFSTPAFCATATCGPQLQVVSELQASHGESANFIHVEIYDNPHEILGDLRNAKRADAVTEWGLPSEPWTFLVDRNGKVADKFEAYTTREELEESLLAVLR